MNNVALSETKKRFVLHWGEMGSQWGVNRTVAQIHSLLYVSDKPLSADQIVEALGVARSNVSNSIRELQGWNLVKTVHVMGDRRDHFETYRDPWKLFQVVLEERKKRELDPSRETLKALVAEAKPDDEYVKKQLEALVEHLDTVAAAYDQFKMLPLETIRKVMRLGLRLRKAVEALV